MKEDTSAIVEPTDVIGTVTDVEIDTYEGDWGDVTRVVLQLDNPNFENPSYKRWKFTRNDQGQIRKNCELNQMVLKPMKFMGRRIVDFDELKGISLHLMEHQLKYNIDDEEIVKDTWLVKGAYDSFDDAMGAWQKSMDIETGTAQEESAAEPEKKAPEESKQEKKDEKKAADPEPEDEPEEESTDEEAKPAGESGDPDLQSYILDYLKGRPKRRIKKETIMAEVLKEFEADDNEVHNALEALKKAKKVREPKFGSFQVM